MVRQHEPMPRNPRRVSPTGLLPLPTQALERPPVEAEGRLEPQLNPEAECVPTHPNFVRREVNPAFSSVIGRVNFMERYGLSVHQAAALVLARRSLGYSERIPRRRLIAAGGSGQVALRVPVGDGGHVDLRVSVRSHVKHVWSLWGAVSNRLKLALAEQRRLGKRACAPTPVEAGPLHGAGHSCEPFGVPGWDSRAESPCAVGAAA